MSTKKKTSGAGLLLNVMIALAAAGAVLLALYPTIANLVNQIDQNENIVVYNTVVQTADTEELDSMWADAKAFNKKIAQGGGLFQLSDEETEEYNSLLNVSGNGLMGYIDIPDENIHLSIFHGTDDEVLETSVGHLEGTSLPTDGDSVHCVITGHTGLPNLDLFTDIHEMETGDTFTVTTLNRVLTYKVDSIDVVLPDDLYGLEIVNGRNYCTLVTCTPYGVNDHRLLVRGRLVDTKVTGTTQDSLESDVIEKANYAVLKLAAIIIAAFLLLIVFIVWLFRKKEPRKDRSGRKQIRISRKN